MMYRYEHRKLEKMLFYFIFNFNRLFAFMVFMTRLKGPCRPRSLKTVVVTF